MNYDIIEADTIIGLAAEVNKAIDAGWAPLGGVVMAVQTTVEGGGQHSDGEVPISSCSSYFYLQAMTKP